MTFPTQSQAPTTGAPDHRASHGPVCPCRVYDQAVDIPGGVRGPVSDPSAEVYARSARVRGMFPAAVNR